MEKILERKAITLIALVITIIVLIILAGITINLTIGQEGILKMAEQSGENYINSAYYEKEQLAELTNSMDDMIVGNRELDSEYVEIDDDTKRIIKSTKQKYKLTIVDLFNNSEYVDKIIESQESIDYILNNKNILNTAIESKYMMTKLLSSTKKDEVVAKLDENCTTIPKLTSINGEDGGKCFGTSPYPAFGFQLWWAFNSDNEYEYAYQRNWKFSIRIRI